MILPLRLYCFGPPRLEQAGQPLSIGRRKGLALLTYLAITNQPHNRDALATLFWPDANQQRARGNLRQVLSELNKALDTNRLLLDREQISLVQDESFWMDVAEFRASLAARKNHQHTLEEICPDCLPLLTTAADLYTDHFLTGFTLRNSPEFDDWQFFESEELRQALSFTLERLVTGHQNQKQYEQALPHARRRLTLDPLHEPTHRQLIILYALDGQQTAALRQYENCVTLLNEELGVEPEEETTRLYEAIKTRRFDELVSEESESRQRLFQTPPPKKTSQVLPRFLQDDVVPDKAAPTFVVRERELSQLKAALTTTRIGQGQTIFVIGGAGRGKTMLVDEFARRAQAEEPELIVIRGHCDAITGIGDPYLPFREAMNMLIGDVEAKWAGGLITQQHARQLWELMPFTLSTLINYAPDLIGSFIPAYPLQERAAAIAQYDNEWFQQLTAISANETRDDLDQSRIFAQYTAVLKAVASKWPVLFIIEDLHWVDTASSGLLFHLSREVADSQILLLGTYRPEEVGLTQISPAQQGVTENHPMAGIVSELKRQHGDIWLDLGDDGSIDGRQFVDAYLDTQPNRLDQSFREVLFQRTGGHALFTVELVTALQERGDLQLDENGRWYLAENIDWKSLPVKVEGVIEKRVERLPQELQAILTVASVEGETFTAEVIAQVQKVEARSLVQQLSRELDKQHRLVSAQALEWLEPGRQRLSIYRFRHQLFQHYLYNRLDEVERGFLHEAVGTALEQLYSGQTEKVAGRLAWHFQIAGLLSKAIVYSEQAGDVSATVYANVEAANHYKLALKLSKQIELDNESLLRLYTSFGRVVELDSQFTRALENYQEMEALAESMGDPTMKLAALIHQGRLRCTTNPEFDAEKGEELSERGLILAQSLNDTAAEAQIQGNLVNLYRWTNRSQNAVEAGQIALRLLAKTDAVSDISVREIDEQAAYIHNDLAHCYFALGSMTQAKESSLKASEAWQKLDNKPMWADSLATAAYVHSYTGEHEKVIALSDEAWNISESIGNIWGQSYSKFRVGYSYWELGRPDLAFVAMKESLHLGIESGFLVPQVWTQTDLALVYGELGAASRGLEIAQQALKVAETQLPIWRAYILGNLAHLHILLGNAAKAENAIEAGKQDPYREAYIVYFVPVLLAEAELALKKKDYQRVIAVTEPLLAHLREFAMRLYVPDVLYLQGQALVGLGDGGAAREMFEIARAEADAMKAKRPLLLILLALSRLENDLETAEELEKQAKQLIEHIINHISDPALKKLYNEKYKLEFLT